MSFATSKLPSLTSPADCSIRGDITDPKLYPQLTIDTAFTQVVPIYSALPYIDWIDSTVKVEKGLACLSKVNNEVKDGSSDMSR